MRFNKLLRDARRAAGLRQSDLVRAGVGNPSTISEVDSGRRATTAEVMGRWLDACNAELVLRRTGQDPVQEDLLRRAMEALRDLPDLGLEVEVLELRASRVRSLTEL